MRKRKSKRGPLERPHQCKYCKAPATKALLWAEHMAFVPVCDDHQATATKHLEDQGDEVEAVRELPAADAVEKALHAAVCTLLLAGLRLQRGEREAAEELLRSLTSTPASMLGKIVGQFGGSGRTKTLASINAPDPGGTRTITSVVNNPMVEPKDMARKMSEEIKRVPHLSLKTGTDFGGSPSESDDEVVLEIEDDTKPFGANREKIIFSRNPYEALDTSRKEVQAHLGGGQYSATTPGVKPKKIGVTNAAPTKTPNPRNPGRAVAGGAGGNVRPRG